MALGSALAAGFAAGPAAGFFPAPALGSSPPIASSISKNGAYVDFQSLKPTRAAGVPKKELGAFKGQVRELVARLSAASTEPEVPPAPEVATTAPPPS